MKKGGNNKNNFLKIRKYLEHTLSNKFKDATGSDLFDWLSLIVLFGGGSVFLGILVLKGNLELKDAVAGFILWFTGFAIFRYTKETYWLKKIQNKQLEFSIMPNAFFILRSKKTEYKRSSGELDLDFPGSTEIKEKLSTKFIVQNNSKFPILFHVRIIFEINGKQCSPEEYYWEKPLHVYPGGPMYCTSVLTLDTFIPKINEIKDKKIIAHIEYTYAPRFAPEKRPESMLEDWIFDLNNYEWRGPGGIQDRMIFLPGELIIPKK